MRKTRISKWLVLMPVIILSACSSNVSGEWDCPKSEGHGCIMIKDADKIALKKAEKQERKVWFAPYQDKSGKKYSKAEPVPDIEAISDEDLEIVAKELKEVMKNAYKESDGDDQGKQADADNNNRGDK